MAHFSLSPMNRALCVSALILLTAPGISQSLPDKTFTVAEGSLGPGSTPVDGVWQFHLGDDPAWALPHTEDRNIRAGWEQIRVDRTWGAQTHPAYTGFAWYRKRIHIDAPPREIALLVQQVDDAYEIYWNGILVGRSGALPPHPNKILNQGIRTYRLEPATDNVLAVRVWKAMLWSTDGAAGGGFYQAPEIGVPRAISARNAEIEYRWLRESMSLFGLEFLNAIVALLSLFMWLRDRWNFLPLAFAALSGVSTLNYILMELPLNISSHFTYVLDIPIVALHDIGLWFLLLYLFNLTLDRKLVLLTKRVAVILFSTSLLDALLVSFDWSNSRSGTPAQIIDAALSAVITLAQAFPIRLLIEARHASPSKTRWAVAATAVLAEMLLVVPIWLSEGSRFTGWQVGDKITWTPLVSIFEARIYAPTIAELLLLISVLYAAYRFVGDSTRRRNLIESELRNAREIQQNLIQEVHPALAGFSVSSSYAPANEVGGDFFQIMPVNDSGLLLVIGDVAGKGLPAAMLVSVLVGAARSIAEFTYAPEKVLTHLNRRIMGRTNGGFSTALAAYFDGDGFVKISNAGHLPPYLDGHEVSLPGALPLGIAAAVSYETTQFRLEPGSRLTFYTDGVIEAQNQRGELFGFERGKAISTQPAEQIVKAAQQFGQTDDITVVVLQREARTPVPSFDDLISREPVIPSPA
jgi:hypothetical protein